MAQRAASRLASRVLADRRRVAVVAREITGLSGVTIFIREQARRAAAAGWSVDAIGERVDAGPLSSVGAGVIKLKRGWFRRSSSEWFAEAAAARTRGRYDLVHGHGDAFDQDVMSLHNCIHAVHEAVHGAPLDAAAPPAETARLHERQFHEGRFRLVVANSKLMRDDIVSRFGVDPARIRVVYPGFDPAQYHPRSRTVAARLLRQRLKIGDDEILVGLVTSGDWEKRGVSTFIEALGIVSHQASMTVHGLVTGKERSIGRYRELARVHGVSRRFHVLPPSAELEPVYGAIDVFVYPAQFEEFGMCVQEAMASGLPLVAGRRIGATELLDPAAAAVLLDEVTPATVAERLAPFVESESLRRQAGALNAASVVRNTWDRSAADLLAVYQELSA